MPPPGALVAEVSAQPQQTPEQIAVMLHQFFAQHGQGSVLEDGKMVFDLASSQHRVSTEHERCTLQLWSGERNLVRTVVAATERKGSLRLSTKRFGHTQTKALLITPVTERREPNRREPARQRYLRLLERVLLRDFPEWQSDGFRAAMDLEHSFGPAYARGTLVRGNEAWAVIGVGSAESQATIDGTLTLGVLWLHHCRERGDGRRIYKGLRLVLPRGAATLTLARLPWMNASAAQWELLELDELSEELLPRDADDQGNVKTRLVHHPDETAARERFATAIAMLMTLIPAGEEHRVEQRLRSTAELAFLLHGLEFARARISLAPGSFTQVLELTVGAGRSETALTAETEDELREHIAELFARRHASVSKGPRLVRPHAPGRGIGAFTGRPAHARLGQDPEEQARPAWDRLEQRERALAAQQDPLFRSSPERWLESVLRENLAPLTRSLAPAPGPSIQVSEDFANERDQDNRGNRAEAQRENSWALPIARPLRTDDRLIPRFDSRFVYTQVPAILGAGDRGMLDLLGMTEDGRLAVIEIKANDDLQLAMQGLDYWIRVRHHHRSTHDEITGRVSPGNDLQQHGYFRGVELSPKTPRLYLIAPALHVHPATETVLRYFSPSVEWTLLALDERWRQEIRVVWRKSGGHPPSLPRFAQG